MGMSQSAEHFNQLTPEQAELLALLSEECGEVVQIIGKTNRHGLASRHPDGGPTNSEALQIELGDLLAAVDLLDRYKVIDKRAVEKARKAKLAKVNRYLHHASWVEHYPPGMGEESRRLHREYNRLVKEQLAGANNAADVVRLTDECNAKGIILVPGGEHL